MNGARVVLHDVLSVDDATCPLVSVLVPLYNHEKYVQECLDSLYRDDYPRIEILVLDDGSSDRSVTRVLEWRTGHPGRFQRFLLATRENAGVTKTLNQLIAAARGDFIAPIASDDFVLASGIRKRVDLFDRHPEWMAVFADCIGIDNSSNKTMNSVIRERFKGDPLALSCPKTLPIELLLNWCVPGPVFMARRDMYSGDALGVGQYNEQLAVEDRDLVLRILAHSSLGFVNTYVAAYRVHPTSASQLESSRARIRDDLVASITANVGLFHGFLYIVAAIAAKREQINIGWSRGSRDLKTAFARMLYGAAARMLLAAGRVWARLVCKTVVTDSGIV